MQTTYNKQQTGSIKKAVISAVIVFILLLVLYYISLQRELAAEKERYGYIAKNQAEHIVTTIDCVMSRTNTLKTLTKENNGDTACEESPG